MTTCIALLRGVNVGRAKRMAMADLRALVERFGHANARTVLNSGNVVFEAERPSTGKLARSLAAAIEATFGFSSAVVVLTSSQLEEVIRENPLQDVATDPTRHLIAFALSAGSLAKAVPLLDQSWAPEAFALGERAAYLWCPGGILDSKLLSAFGRLTGDAATTRNWATVLKLQAAAGRGR